MGQYKVGEVARIAHVSVRSLHHYDEIGLLAPSERSEAGYRLYSDDDLRRLSRIRFYRELDFSLEEISSILADPGAGPDAHLRRQHRLLRERLTRTQMLLAALEREMEAHEMGMSLTPEEQLEVFGTDKLDEYAEEAQERWGDSEAWRQSRRRTAAYSKDDWVTIKRQADANLAGFAEAMRAGEPADAPRATGLAEDHRQHICRWFYACSPAMHRGLAELIVGDERFARTYEELAPGLAQYVHDAFVANAAGGG